MADREIAAVAADKTVDQSRTSRAGRPLSGTQADAHVEALPSPHRRLIWQHLGQRLVNRQCYSPRCPVTLESGELPLRRARERPDRPRIRFASRRSLVRSRYAPSLFSLQVAFFG